jgi:RNA polymerase sigma factor (sigma-70 family)
MSSDPALGNRTAGAGHSGCVGPEHLPDSELWQRAALHDSGAFADLFDRHAERVYNHCFRRTADWSLAEDLTSVVFLEAWRRRKQVRMYEDSVLPWLLAVANNCLRNAERSRRRYKRLLAKLPKPEDPTDLDAETSERIDDAESIRRILVVVDQLSRENQEVIALCDWSGLTYEEAAAALAIPIGTVKSRLSRAHGRLRALMDPETGGVQQPSTDLKGGRS